MSGKMCAVVGCHNSTRKLRIWRKSTCELHTDMLHADCPCLVPYILHSLPKASELRREWLKSLNRKDYTPSNGSVICSRHFIDGEKTAINPVPTIDMGYGMKGVKRGQTSKRHASPDFRPDDHVFGDNTNVFSLIDNDYSALDRTIKVEIDDHPVDVKPEIVLADFERHYDYPPEEELFDFALKSEETYMQVKEEWDAFDFASPSENISMNIDDDIDPFCVAPRFVDETMNVKHPFEECMTAGESPPSVPKLRSNNIKTETSESSAKPDRFFECRYCEAKFWDMKNFLDHVDANCQDHPWKHSCSICKRIFQSKSKLDYHFKTHDKSYKETTDTFDCTCCSLKFKSKEKLTEHMKLAKQGSQSALLPTTNKRKKDSTTIIDRHYECRFCEMKFTDWGNFLGHVNSNCKEMPWKLSCVTCKRLFQSERLLNNHVETHSRPPKRTSKELFRCTCVGRFKSQEQLTKHLELVREMNLRCLICDKMFCTVKRFNRHKSVHEAKPKTSMVPLFYLNCVSCNEYFTSDNELQVHKILQPDCRHFQCTLCPYKHLHFSCYQKHIKTHNENQIFICPTENCNQVYNTSMKLAEHVILLHRNNMFVCSVCKDSFPSKELMKEHCLNHPAYSIFNCNTCSKTFYDLSDLIEHVKIHTDDK